MGNEREGVAVEIWPTFVFFRLSRSQRDACLHFWIGNKVILLLRFEGYFISMPSFDLLERSSHAFRSQTIFENLFIIVFSNKNIKYVRKILEFSVKYRMLPRNNYDYEYSEEENEWYAR